MLLVQFPYYCNLVSLELLTLLWCIKSFLLTVISYWQINSITDNLLRCLPYQKLFVTFPLISPWILYLFLCLTLITWEGETRCSTVIALGQGGSFYKPGLLLKAQLFGIGIFAKKFNFDLDDSLPLLIACS